MTFSKLYGIIVIMTSKDLKVLAERINNIEKLEEDDFIKGNMIERLISNLSIEEILTLDEYIIDLKQEELY